MRVLVACEESQIVTIAFRKLGHEAYSCDIKPCSGGHPEWHFHCDVRQVLDRYFDMLIAHPVCKRLANSGVRWLHNPPPGKTVSEMWNELQNAVEFYKLFRDVKINKKAIENPIMHMYAKLLIGTMNKRQIVQPWWFGDPYFKATGFELFNLPELKPTNKLIPPAKGTEEYKKWEYIHRLPPSKDREELRSKTFPGIARAMAEQWT